MTTIQVNAVFNKDAVSIAATAYLADSANDKKRWAVKAITTIQSMTQRSVGDITLDITIYAELQSYFA